MHSTLISALAILAVSIISLASPTPAGPAENLDRETGGQEARGFERYAFHETTTSPNLSAVVKQTLQLGCTRNLICDSVVTESMCSAAFRQIIEDTTYRTGLGPEYAEAQRPRVNLEDMRHQDNYGTPVPPTAQKLPHHRIHHQTLTHSKALSEDSKMSDADLEEIRKARLAQLQQQASNNSGGGGGGDEQRKQQEASARTSLLSQILLPDASDRLGRIRLVNEARATDVENRLIMLAQTGQLRQKVTEEQLKDLLGRVKDGRGEERIVVVRRGVGSEDDDE